MLSPASVLFFFNDTATTEIYTLSLHDALPIFTLKLKVGDCRQRIEIFAVRHCCFAVVMQDMARVVSVHMIAYERETPVKRPHEAVVIPLVVRALAPVHECFPQNSINLCSASQSGRAGASPLPNLYLVKPE